MDKNLIEEVKNTIDIIAEVQQFTDVKPNGQARCPFPGHEDQNASFHVYQQTHSWYCFAEGIGGDIYDFYHHLKNQAFWDTFTQLATQLQISTTFTSEEKKAIEDNRTIAKVLSETSKYYNAQLTEFEAAKKFLKERNISSESIEAFQIGYANGKLKKQLLEKFPLDLCLKAGVLTQLQDGTVIDYFYDRITFPHILHSQVINMTGRTIDKKNEDNEETLSSAQDTEEQMKNKREIPKYKHLRGEIQHLYNEKVITEKEPAIVEGVLDVIALAQKDIPAVALLSTNLKQEHVKKFSNCEAVILMFDGDDAGYSAIIKIGKLFGTKAKVFRLKKGQDPDDYVFSHSKETIARQLAKLPDFYTYWIHEIKKNTDRIQLPKVLEPLLRQLSMEEEIYWETVLDEIKDYFGLKPKERTAYRKQMVRFHNEKLTKEKDDLQRQISQGIQNTSEQKKIEYLFHPALTIDRKTQRVLVGIPKHIPKFIDGKVEYEEQITIVSNSGEKWDLIEEEIEKRSWYPLSIPSFGLGKTRCSEKFISSISPMPKCDHGDHCYRIKQGVTNPYTEIFLPIRSIFEQFIDFSNPAHSTILTLWTIGTYLFVLFPAYPYLHPNGFQDSGKSKIGDIINRLGFNAVSAANSSASALFRTIEANLVTFLLDEAEQFTGWEVNPDLRLILNAGYKANNTVRRTNPNTFKPEDFSIYSPKVITSINPLERTLASRCIPILMLRTANGQIGTSKVTDNTADWQEIRDNLYTFLLSHALCVAEIYDHPNFLSNLNNRNSELFSPLFAIARYIDTYVLSEEQKLLPIVDRFASELVGEAEELDDWSLWVLQAIDTLVTDTKAYLIKQIREEILKSRILEGEKLDDRLTGRVIGSTLKKFGFRKGPDRNVGKTYMLNRDKIENLKVRFTSSPSKDGNYGNNSHQEKNLSIMPMIQSTNQQEEITTLSDVDTITVDDFQMPVFTSESAASTTIDLQAVVQELYDLDDKYIRGLLPKKTVSDFTDDELPIYHEGINILLARDKFENRDLYTIIAKELETELKKRGIPIAQQNNTTRTKPPIDEQPSQYPAEDEDPGPIPF